MSHYTLTLHAYCGMAQPQGRDDMDHDGARQAAARLIRRRRREDFPVTTLDPGKRWEIMEPDDCFMVPDSCGVLVLRAPGQDVPL